MMIQWMLVTVILLPGSSTMDPEIVRELKDLLMDSVKNTVALNDLVTHQTQQISELMLTLSSTQTKLHRMEIKNQLLESQLAALRGDHDRLRNFTATLERRIGDVCDAANNGLAELDDKIIATNNKLVTLEDHVEDMNDEQDSLKISANDGLVEVLASLSTTNSRLATLESGIAGEIEAVKGKIQEMGNEVMIVSGEESNGGSGCAKVCSGTTGRGSTNWINHGDHIQLDVDISMCGFAKLPTITTTIEGGSYIYYLTGTSAIHCSSTSSFRIYLYLSRSYSNIYYKATSNNWNVEWIAVGHTC